jgi:hypothetical protein
MHSPKNINQFNVKPEIQKTLVALAEEIGLKTQITGETWVLRRGGQPSEPPVAVVHLDHPQPEVIFAILLEIGRFYIRFRNPRPLPMPSFVNRPYENEILGDAAYKIRRAIRLKCGEVWQANLWALCAYGAIGCPDDLKAFLEQHPEKLPFVLLAMAGHVKFRIGKFIRKLFHCKP